MISIRQMTSKLEGKNIKTHDIEADILINGKSAAQNWAEAEEEL